MEFTINTLLGISVILGALVIVGLLYGWVLKVINWTCWEWERMTRRRDGWAILCEYHRHREEFLAWREEQKK